METLPIPSPLFIYLFIGLIGAEYLLSALWVPFYFRVGIPLYRQHYKLAAAPPKLESYIPQLEAQLPRDWWRAAVVFRALGPYELAFRHSLKRRSRNIIYGRVQFDLISQEITVSGYLTTWFWILLPLIAFLTGLWQKVFFLFILFLFLILIINAIVQRLNYGRVGQVVQTIFEATSWQPDSDPIPYQTTNDPLYPDPLKPSGQNHWETVLIGVLILLLLITGLVFSIIWFTLK